MWLYDSLTADDYLITIIDANDCEIPLTVTVSAVDLDVVLRSI